LHAFVVVAIVVYATLPLVRPVPKAWRADVQAASCPRSACFQPHSARLFLAFAALAPVLAEAAATALLALAALAPVLADTAATALLALEALAPVLAEAAATALLAFAAPAPVLAEAAATALLA